MKPAYLEISTTRLDLIAATPELAEAELLERARLSSLLAARLPSDWPPPFNDADSARWVADHVASHPNAAGWIAWYFVLREDVGRVVIGNGGFKGEPAHGTVEIGYSIVPEFQRKGYAFEAMSALIAWAFDDRRVRRIVAETLPELHASQGLLAKLGFSEVSTTTSDTLRFERMRPLSTG